MKFDNYFYNYLVTNKTLSLKAIGTFTLNENFVIPTEPITREYYPEDGILFESNKKAITSEELIAFIKLESRKPITLISSDLEDYILQIRDWLNIGKPYTIEGIGSLVKLHSGQYEFSYGKIKNENISGIVTSSAKKEYEYGGIKKRINVDKSKLVKTLLLTFIFLLVMAGAWLGINYFIKNNKTSNISQNGVPKENTTILSADTNTKPKTTLITAANKSDTLKYKMFFLASKYLEKADRIYAIWSKQTTINRDSVIIDDTMRHRLFIYRRLLPKDTLKIKSEMAIYFNHSITLEVEN